MVRIRQWIQLQTGVNRASIHTLTVFVSFMLQNQVLKYWAVCLPVGGNTIMSN